MGRIYEWESRKQLPSGLRSAHVSQKNKEKSHRVPATSRVRQITDQTDLLFREWFFTNDDNSVL